MVVTLKPRWEQRSSTLMDGEFIPMRHELTAMGIHPNSETENEHMPEIERQIHVLKEHTRACRHSLTFTYLPLLIII